MTLLGTGKEYTLSADELKCFKSDSKKIVSLRFEKLLFHGVRYTCESYDRCQKTCGHFLETTSGEFGLIQNIMFFPENQNDKVKFFFKKLSILGPFLKTNDCVIDHIKECADPFIDPNFEYKICNADDIHRPCIFMRTPDKCYISSIPKGLLISS